MNANKKTVIDSHCHYFNGGFALREAIAIGWNKLRGNYPYRTTSRGIEEQKLVGAGIITGVMAAVEGWTDLISYVADLLKITVQSCKENFNYNMNEFKKSELSNNYDLLTAPLMMDIYFILDNNENEASPLLKRAIQPSVPSSPVITEGNEAFFKQYLVEVKSQVNELLKNKNENLKSHIRRPDEFNKKVDELFEAIEQEFIPATKKIRESSFRQLDDLSPGYKNHLTDLLDLQKQNTGKVFPFLAVDPRRRDIIKLIEEYVNPVSGPFKGIKLYPPLGYLPSHPDLEPVYAYCVKNDIPITVHTSCGGLPNFRKKIFVRSFDKKHGDKWIDLKQMGITSQEYFANPDNWIPVLDKFTNLRLNFAHFGGNDQCLEYPADNWTKKIINIMEIYAEKHPNIYCDMSYYTKDSEISISKIMSEHPIVKERLMFGTDYIMIMMDYNLGGLAKYYDLHDYLNDEQYFKNAKSFLNL